MSIARHHAEWLSLVEVSGPFLSMPVLLRVFPQGLEKHDSDTFRLLREAYEEWEDNQQAGKHTNPAIHAAWIKFVLGKVLQLPAEAVAEGQGIPQTLQTTVAEHGETLRPNLVVVDQRTHNPRLLIQTYPASQNLSKPVAGSSWKASPDTRMMELLHATDIPLGLVTNGEQWMLVDAPRNETTGYASWYAHLWLEEPITLRAFTSLLNLGRFFSVPDADTLAEMLKESAANQQEVTDQLGYQVRKAVEVLVQSLDRADQDHGRALLAEIKETELYEAALTVMMRLVFLFCGEERGLLLLGDPIFDQHYAVSTLEKQLRETADQHGEEILERRHDAWCRLLSTVRAVYGGVAHERMTLPPYGGRLFDPDRFAFLEGRKRGTTWRDTPAEPLPINNRTVLHLLDALQLLQVKVPGGGPAEARRLSFRALDIEQIGHVYEGLLDHTAKRATEPVLGLVGSKDKEPEVALSELEKRKAQGEAALIEFLNEETGKSPKALTNILHGEADLTELRRFEAVCGTSPEGRKLLERITPFVGLIRDDTFGYPVVIPTGSVYVTEGTDRRSSGTHYTPRSLTEPIVQYTLEPLVYVGPAEGKPKDQWQLRTPAELLKLKICDMTCGSGAFHVQTCRYLAERLVEAWEQAERNLPSPGPGKLNFPTITPEGKPSTGQPGETLIPKDADERLAYAKRIVAQRCIYGVDINPLAADMAKLSLWLLTLAKDKPFTFLDHTIRCGDSLLGIHDLQQLKTFSLDGKGEFQYLFTTPLDELVDEAIALRLTIETMPSNTVEEVEAQARLLVESERKLAVLKCAADMLLAAELKGGSPRERLENRDHAAIQVGYYLKEGKLEEFRALVTKELGGRRAFHWPLEFPEVFAQGGFDGFVGNPPFMGAKKITGMFSTGYRDYLIEHIAGNIRGHADLCGYFVLRASSLVVQAGHIGLLSTNTIGQGETREVTLERLIAAGFSIVRAVPSRQWPGVATVEIAHLYLRRGSWQGPFVLNDNLVPHIDSFLSVAAVADPEPLELAENYSRAFQGSNIRGVGFILDPSVAEAILKADGKNKDVIFPYLIGQDLNSRPDQSPSRFVINFFDWPKERAASYPIPFQIVVEKVLPERLKIKHEASRKKGTGFFWQYDSLGKDLYATIRQLPTVFVRSRVSNLNIVVKVATGIVFSDATVVFAFADDPAFCVLQGCFHTTWLERFSSTMRTDVRYTPSSCFDTFPFPNGLIAAISDHLPVLRLKGSEYQVYRRSLCEAGTCGLTKLYNRFHDTEEAAADIQKLRDLHVEMDKAVAVAYGWDDLKLDHGFHQTKQGLRFTISEPARREVLARLLKLNHERYAEEVAAGLHERGKGKGGKGQRKMNDGGQTDLF